MIDWIRWLNAWLERDPADTVGIQDKDGEAFISTKTDSFGGIASEGLIVLNRRPHFDIASVHHMTLADAIFQEARGSAPCHQQVKRM